jgi:hypothetical protein
MLRSNPFRLRDCPKRSVAQRRRGGPTLNPVHGRETHHRRSLFGETLLGILVNDKRDSAAKREPDAGLSAFRQSRHDVRGNAMLKPPNADRRSERTRRSLVTAFNELRIVACADVGRSTFYERFENKSTCCGTASRRYSRSLRTRTCTVTPATSNGSADRWASSDACRVRYSGERLVRRLLPCM